MDVDRRGILGPEPAGGRTGTSLSWHCTSVEQYHIAPPTPGQVIGNARAHHTRPDDHDRARLHAVKTCSGCLKLLNSSALPLGSRRNIVACSPGCPAYRMV